MDLNDMYSALSTGVVDMVSLTPTALLPPWRLSEIAKHVTAGISGLHNPCGAIMNKESYAALSPAHKQAFDKLTGKPLAMKAAKIFDNWEAAAFKLAMESDKIEVVRLSPQERKQFFDAANPVVQKVIADLEQSGVKDVRAAYKAMNK
jgi:TRAP-type C4-dicarboxylate transport system substrate-binding protein